MPNVKDAATAFLATRRMAVTGVSRRPQGHGGNIVYQRLRDRGYEVFPVNPNAGSVEGDACYADIASIPGGVEAVVIATSPDHADATMQECIDADVKHVWMHRSLAGGSVSESAAALGRGNGLTVIDGGCPLMFLPTADIGHRAMRAVLTLTGKVPRKV